MPNQRTATQDNLTSQRLTLMIHRLAVMLSQHTVDTHNQLTVATLSQHMVGVIPRRNRHLTHMIHQHKVMEATLNQPTAVVRTQDQALLLSLLLTLLIQVLEDMPSQRTENILANIHRYMEAMDTTITINRVPSRDKFIFFRIFT
jgi:hypothetical protein